MRTGSPPAEAMGFDAELGWSHAPGSGSGEFVFDRFGARIGATPAGETVAGADDPAAARLGTFGCSFTIGVQVAAHESWPAVLDRLEVGTRVFNLGVAGYGLDQAFLRWRAKRAELALGEVWLGFLPAAALRNLSMYRPALRHWSDTVAFKPRFALGPGDALELVPNPARSFAELARLVRTQSEFCAALGRHDAWVRRAPAAWAPAGSHWSHRFAASRVALTLYERGGRDVAAELADERSETFRVCRAIVLAMAAEVAEDGGRFRFLVLPDRPGLRAAAGGRAYWDGLARALASEGVEVVDLSGPLDAAGAIEEDAFWLADGHYAPAAHAAVAEALAAARSR